MNNPCPCCERNARLLTTDEYDQLHDEGMSEAVMSETLNEAIQTARENENGSRTQDDRGRPSVLRPIHSGKLGAKRLAPVTGAKMREDVPFAKRVKLTAYINRHSERDIADAINAEVRAQGLRLFDDDGIANIAGRLLQHQRRCQNAHRSNRAPAPAQFLDAAE